MTDTEYREYAPHVGLSEAIACYWTLRADGTLIGASEPRRVLPDGCIDIVFNLGDPLRRIATKGISINRLPWYVVGPMTHPVEVQTTGRVDIIGVRFRPGYAKIFLTAPAHDFADKTLALQDVWGQRGEELGAKLAETDLSSVRIRTLNEDLLRRYRSTQKPSGPIRLAVSMLLESGGQAKIAQVASRCGISSRHLGRQFEGSVGLSPKLFARIVRFQKTLATARGSPAPDWLTSVFEGGYYDQSHMIKDFREFSHSSPARLSSEP